MSKSLPDIKILFFNLRNFEKQIRNYKKRKAPYHKAFHIRRAPLFDKTVRKAGLIHYGGAGGNRTPVRKCIRGDFSGRRESFLFPRPRVDAHTRGSGSFIVHGALKALRTHVRR